MTEPEAVVVRRETYYTEREYVKRLENLASAVLLFHRGGEWTKQDSIAWQVLTGNTEVTTKALCDFARECQKESA